MYRYKCIACNDIDIDKNEYIAGLNMCDTCVAIRENNPKLFDLVLKMIGKVNRNIDDEIDKHTQSYTHERHYDYD